MDSSKGHQKIKNSAPVLPEPLVQVQGPTPQGVWGVIGYSWRAWYRSRHTILAESARPRQDSLPRYAAWVEVWVGFL